jgi:hypothetical protein
MHEGECNMASYVEQLAKTLWESMSLPEIRLLEHALQEGAHNFLYVQKPLSFYNLEPDVQRMLMDIVARTIKIYEATKSVTEVPDVE